jgi:hypothetical protein
MSVSQFKDFMKCPAMAMAKLNGIHKDEEKRALLLGSFVDEMLTGTYKSQIKFIAENYTELFQKSNKVAVQLSEFDTLSGRKDFLLGCCEPEYFFLEHQKPYADILQAVETIERVKNQPLMMHYLSGKHQVIMTGEIEGVPFKIKMDSFDPNEYICDLKYMASLRSPNLFEPMIKYWGYDIQAAYYQEIVRQNIGKRLPFIFDVATKEKPAHLEVGEISQWNMDEALETVRKNIKRFQAIKNGEVEAERCEDYNCDYCTTTKIIKEPIDTDLFGMSAAQIKSMRGEL